MMEKHFENTDALIAKFLAGESTAAEVVFLENWRKASPENELYFKDHQKMFASFDAIKSTETFDVDVAWNSLNKKISAEPRIIPLYRRPVFLRVAASLLLLFSLGMVIKLLLNQSNSEPLRLMAGTKSIATALPDGSKVFMHKNSEISYVQDKNGQRQVILKGEAFFEVVHDETKPFIVTMDEVMVKDIGTGFNVKENNTENTVEVLVESGEVLFFTADNAGISLVKGEKAVYDKISKQFTKTTINPSENITSYKSRIFEFRDTPLKEVIKQINDVYGSDIRLGNEALGEHHLVVVFNNEQIDQIVTVIAETLDLDVERNGTVILLKNKSVSN